ncbi:transporter [Acinetobacter sp. V91_7]|uniref:transporter n=1 Tax=unclassified Acinetobacter TaxID=196816 RepID=UPI00287DEA35|nr:MULTISPECIES: transporter [unclassified Acinetobacter]MDS7932893.1 transporter [Acinetobacter sp. V91_4B]MDS7961846.1 transporter [Acinetobacter sp. V91_7]MDS8028919.1 transporter [Acinetobacter sp. V91_13]
MKLKPSFSLIMGTLGLSTLAHAIEVQPGDFEVLPDSKSLALLYYTHTQGDQLYQNGEKLSDRAKLQTDIGIARFISAIHPIENLSLEPQVILPFGQVKTSDDIAALGKASGIGDVMIGMPIKYALSPANTMAIAPFISIPSGSYYQDKALNLGENRWNGTLQTAWLHHFDQDITLENIFDATIYSNNDRYSRQSLTLKQDPKYEYQLYLRYNLSPITAFGIGGGWIGGGETKLNGVNQNDKVNTTYAKITASHFFTPLFQTSLTIGRDIKVEQGVKQDSDFTLRLGYLF